MQATGTSRDHLGVRRRRLVSGGTLLRNRCWPRQACPHPCRAPLCRLERVWPWRGRCWLGDGPDGTRDPSRTANRLAIGRSRLRRVSGRQSIHHRQQPRLGANGHRVRNGPRCRVRRGKAYNRILYRRISRAHLMMDGVDLLRAPPPTSRSRVPLEQRVRAYDGLGNR